MIPLIRAGIVGAVLVVAVALMLNTRAGSSSSLEVTVGPLFLPAVVDQPARFGAGSPSAGFTLGQGWYAPESDFAWSEGQESALTFRLPEDVDEGDLTLALSVLGFSPGPPDSGRATRFTLEVAGNEARIEELVGASLTLIHIPVPSANAGDRASLRIVYDDPLRPCDVLETGDCRLLSIRIYEAELRRSGNGVSP